MKTKRQLPRALNYTKKETVNLILADKLTLRISNRIIGQTINKIEAAQNDV